MKIRKLSLVCALSILFGAALSPIVSVAATIPQAGTVPIVLDQVATTDNITYLMGAGARRPDTTEVWRPRHPKHTWLQSFDTTTEFLEWDVQAAIGAEYHVIALIGPVENNQSFRFQVVDGNSLNFTAAVSKWQRVDAGKVYIPAGNQTLRLKRTTSDGDVRVKSLEIMMESARPDYLTRVTNFRSDTSTLNSYDYGLMFQYGAWGVPPVGAPKSIEQQANDFDVPAFVTMVERTGAKYVIWSATWWTYELNAPITAVDTILGHSNNTSSRDLIGDIATALENANIGFYLYYHTGQDTDQSGYESTEWWRLQEFPREFRDSGLGDKTTFVNNWISVITEIGNRYGTKLDGWLFDDGLVYYPAPFEKMGAVTKAGNPNRLISYNSWVAVLYTEFAEFAFGEHCTIKNDAPVGGSGLLTRGKDAGVFGHCMNAMEEDWGIYERQREIDTLNYSVQSALSTVQNLSSRKIPQSFNMMMREDGSVSGASLDVLVGLKWALRTPPQCQGVCTTFNDIGSGTVKSGGWLDSSNRGEGDYQDDVSYVGANGAYLEYTFTGTKVELYGPADRDQGNIEVFIDGVSQGVINTYGSSYSAQQLYFESGTLSAGRHTVKMVKKSGHWMRLDKIVISLEDTIINDTDSGTVKWGDWDYSSNRGEGDYQDDVSYVGANGSYLEYTFLGTKVRLYGPADRDQGNIEVFIDGVSQGVINTYGPSYSAQELYFESETLSAGRHTVTMVKKSGTWMRLDRIAIMDSLVDSIDNDADSGCS